MLLDVSLEDAMAQLAAIIIPITEELGGTSPSIAAATLVRPFKSFFRLCMTGLMIFILARISLRVLLEVLQAVLRGATLSLSLIREGSLRYLKRGICLVSKTSQPRYRTTRTRLKESSSGFESWEQFFQRHNMGIQKDSHREIEHALMRLSLTSLASEQEIPRA